MTLRERTLNTTLRQTLPHPWILRFNRPGSPPPDWLVPGHRCELIANARDWFPRCLAAAVYRVPIVHHRPDRGTRLEVVVAYGTPTRPDWYWGVVKEET